MMEYGRAQHRAWLVEVLGPHLRNLSPGAREQRITELYAATDAYLWNLLRRDLRIVAQRTADAFRRLVLGVIGLKEKRLDRKENNHASSLGRDDRQVFARADDQQSGGFADFGC